MRNNPSFLYSDEKLKDINKDYENELNNEKERIAKETKSKQSEIDEKQKEKNKTQSEIGNLQRKKNEKQNVIDKKNDEFETNIRNFQSKIADNNIKLKGFESSLKNESDALSNQELEFNKKVSENKNELQTKQSELQAKQNELQTKRGELSEKQSELEAKRNELSEKQSESKKQIDELFNNKKQITQDLDTALVNKRVAESNFNENKKEIKRLVDNFYNNEKNEFNQNVNDFFINFGQDKQARLDEFVDKVFLLTTQLGDCNTYGPSKNISDIVNFLKIFLDEFENLLDIKFDDDLKEFLQKLSENSSVGNDIKEILKLYKNIHKPNDDDDTEIKEHINTIQKNSEKFNLNYRKFLKNIENPDFGNTTDSDLNKLFETRLLSKPGVKHNYDKFFLLFITKRQRISDLSEFCRIAVVASDNNNFFKSFTYSEIHDEIIAINQIYEGLDNKLLSINIVNFNELNLNALDSRLNYGQELPNLDDKEQIENKILELDTLILNINNVISKINPNTIHIFENIFLIFTEDFALNINNYILNKMFGSYTDENITDEKIRNFVFKNSIRKKIFYEITNDDITVDFDDINDKKIRESVFENSNIKKLFDDITDDDIQSGKILELKFKILELKYNFFLHYLIENFLKSNLNTKTPKYLKELLIIIINKINRRNEINDRLKSEVYITEFIDFKKFLKNIYAKYLYTITLLYCKLSHDKDNLESKLGNLKAKLNELEEKALQKKQEKQNRETELTGRLNKIRNTMDGIQRKILGHSINDSDSDKQIINIINIHSNGKDISSERLNKIEVAVNGKNSQEVIEENLEKIKEYCLKADTAKKNLEEIQKEYDEDVEIKDYDKIKQEYDKIKQEYDEIKQEYDEASNDTDIADLIGVIDSISRGISKNITKNPSIIQELIGKIQNFINEYCVGANSYKEQLETKKEKFSCINAVNSEIKNLHDLLIVASNNIYDSFNNIPEQVISDMIEPNFKFYNFIHRDNEVKNLIQSFTNENELFTNFTSIVEGSKTKKIEECESKEFDDFLNDFVTMPTHDEYKKFKTNVFDRFQDGNFKYNNIVIAKIEGDKMKIQKNNITDTNKSFRDILAESADGKKPYLEFETTQDYTRYIRIGDLQIFLQDIIELEKNLSDLNNRTCGFTIGDETVIETIRGNFKTFFDECKDIIVNFETIFKKYGSFTPEGSTLLLIENLEGFDETDFKTITFRPNIYKYLKWFYNTHIRPVIIAFYKKCQEIKSEIKQITNKSSINNYNFNNTTNIFGKIYLLFISLYVYEKYGWGSYKRPPDTVNNKWSKKFDINFFSNFKTKWNEEKDININDYNFNIIYSEIYTLIKTGLEIFDDKYLKFPPKSSSESSNSVYSILVPYFFSGNITGKNQGNKETVPPFSGHYKDLTFEGKDSEEREDQYKKIAKWFVDKSNKEYLTGFNIEGFWGNNLTMLFGLNNTIHGINNRIFNRIGYDVNNKIDLEAHNKTFLYFDKITITDTKKITLDKVCSLLYSNIGKGDYDSSYRNPILHDKKFRVNFAKFVVLFSFLFNSTSRNAMGKSNHESDIITFVRSINSKNCVAGKSGSSSGKPGPSSGEKFENPLCDRKGRPDFNLNTNPKSDIPIGTIPTGTQPKKKTGVRTYPSGPNTARVLGTESEQGNASGQGTTRGQGTQVVRLKPTRSTSLGVSRGGNKTKRIRRGKRTRHNKKKITRPLRKIKSNLTKKK